MDRFLSLRTVPCYGLSFGIIVFGTISFTFWMVGANGLIFFTFVG